MKVQVDPERCQGHTLCAMASPAVFLLRDEDGHAYVDESKIRPDVFKSIRDAGSTCPEQAITVEEA